jgi:hypothetical protein
MVERGLGHIANIASVPLRCNGPRRIDCVGSYGRFSPCNGRAADGLRPGPMMGQDNDYVFKELLEIPEERYRRLLDEKVIY